MTKAARLAVAVTGLKNRERLLARCLHCFEEPIDFGKGAGPTLFLTEVTPQCSSLGKWWTLAIGNWEDESVTRSIRLSNAMIPEGPSRFAVLEFKTQEFMGLFGLDDDIEITIPAHGIRVLRLTPWDAKSPRILGTDLHITGGACEIAECTISE